MDNELEQVTEDNEYPQFRVGFDPQIVTDNAIAQVLGRLLELDMDRAREAIFGRGEKEADGDFDIIVTMPGVDEGGPVLEFSLHSITFLDVQIEPAKFDRTSPKQEAIYQRCATLVKAFHESPYSKDADYTHPRLSGFMFWCRNEDQTGEQAAAEWATLAEIWQV